MEHLHFVWDRVRLRNEWSECYLFTAISQGLYWSQTSLHTASHTRACNIVNSDPLFSLMLWANYCSVHVSHGGNLHTYLSSQMSHLSFCSLKWIKRNLRCLALVGGGKSHTVSLAVGSSPSHRVGLWSCVDTHQTWAWRSLLTDWALPLSKPTLLEEKLKCFVFLHFFLKNRNFHSCSLTTCFSGFAFVLSRSKYSIGREQQHADLQF